MYGASFPGTLKLQGIDRARYFAPVVFFGFLSALCLALITVSAFLVTVRDALAITAAGLFGLVSTGAAGALILRLQLRWLRYTAIPISTDRETAFGAVRRLVSRFWLAYHPPVGERPGSPHPGHPVRRGRAGMR